VNTDRNVKEAIDALEGIFLKHENLEYAKAQAAYMKNHFPFYGIQSSLRKQCFLVWKGEEVFKEIARDNLIQDLIRALWTCDQRDYQYIAIEIINGFNKNQLQQEDIYLIKDLIVNKSWWDSVDAIASNILGKYVLKFPEEGRKMLDEWSCSENLWLMRATLIFQLKYRDKTDFELLKGYILKYSSNKEFFIQKAIGWSLRQYSKTNPDVVSEFVKSVQLSNLAYREATKYL